MGPRGIRALLATTLWLATAVNGAPSKAPSRSPEPCPDTVEWSEGRQAAEGGTAAENHEPIGSIPDASLKVAVDQYWVARLHGDLAGLLELEISQSDEHLDVETRHLKKMLAEDVRLHSDNWRVAPYSYWVDETNPVHVWVYSTVVLRLNDRCVEDGIVTEWVRFQDDWLTLPEGQRVFNAAKKGRPNRRYVPK